MLYNIKKGEEEFFYTVRKLRKFLEEREIADTFSFIKSLNTIELSGFADNGRERVLFDDIKSEFGTDVVSSSEHINYLIPPFPEGVIKSRTQYGTIYYTHFRVISKTEESYNLEVKEYDFHEGIFYLRYIVTITNICNYCDEQSKHEEGEIYYSCVKQFLLNTFSEEDLKEVFNKRELNLLQGIAEKDDKILEDEINKIIKYILTTFQAINFLSGYKKEQNNKIKNKETVNSVMVINNEENYQNKDSIRVIDMEKFFQLRPASKNKQTRATTTRTIVRKTNKWLVQGHVRTYKNGKTVYIDSYYKGVNRTSNTKSKTTIIYKKTNKDN